MSDENDIIVQEIYEYYKDKPSLEPKADEPQSELEKEKKNIVSAASSVISGVGEKVSRAADKLSGDKISKRSMYIIFASLSAVLVIMCGYIIGLIIPKNEEITARELENLKSSSARYTEALESNERLNKRVNELYDEEADIKAELEGITDYEAIRDRSKQDMDDISAQLGELNAKVEEKQSELKELDGKIKDIGDKITLPPGMYTVGEHIAAGEYYVTGDGSLLVSGTQNNLKINTRLTESVPYTCQLSGGDIIKLETEAEFNPVE